ncbi:MAG: insulinase family protein [Eubacteriales bacterium]
MQYKTNEAYHGFQLIEERDLKEINSKGLLFQHQQTGARLFYITNDDDNKVFSISFRTPPEDSTGLPHILEHSVLCGSQRYPIKEPFVELIKGSLNTFLNAMTFPDKTMYPIASENDKDFMNLMDVYLDAVFYPNIHNDKSIFLQEGWHYHLEDEKDDIQYVGVVYNEMKGAFSNPDEVVNRKIQESLFPDTPYGKESGGDPDNITELSYEQFIEFHKKYYHPSNSYIYLYGNGNVLEHLAYIHENYLSQYEKISVDSTIPIQQGFTEGKECKFDYPVSKNESIEDKTYLAMNFVTGVSTDGQLHLSMEILTHILLNSPSAPLKKALLEAQLGKDVTGSFEGGILQPVINIIIKNSNENQKEKFHEVVMNTLKDLVKKGISRDQIQAAINITEFRLKEADYGSYPKGLIYGINIMDSWLYDGDPTIHLYYEEYLSYIKNSLKDGYFENLIQKYLLDNQHRSLLVLSPKQGLVDEIENREDQKLQEYKNKLSDSEVKELIRETQKLIKKQNTPDDEEDIKKIPVLPIEDIRKENKPIPTEIKEVQGCKVIFHPIKTNGVLYIDMLFDIDAVEPELLPYVSLLARYLGEVSTKDFSFEEMNNEVQIHTGGIDYDIDVYADIHNSNDFSSKFIVKGKGLKENVEKLFQLFTQILVHSRYDEKQRLKEIIQSSKAKTEMNFLGIGHKIVANRVHSYYMETAKFLELVNGLDYYYFIRELEENFEARWEEIFSNLKKACTIMFNANNVMVSLTCDEECYPIFQKNFNIVYDKLYRESIEKKPIHLTVEKLNEGLKTSSKVQYVGKGCNIKKIGYDYHGSLQVLKTILSTDYLWNKVRVQGGAYGSFFSIGKSGVLFIGSYRDPHLKNTVDIFNSTFEYLRNFNTSQRELRKYIIGTVSNLDTPMTPWTKGNTATGNYLRNISQEELQKEREEILHCTLEDIKQASKLMKDCMEANYLCVLGNEKRIENNSQMFQNIIDLFK